MKQALRIVIPLLVLVAVVFGATYFSQYTRKQDDDKTVKSPEPPLRFGSSTRKWTPIGSPQDRVFPGFYEPQGKTAGPRNSASFWFENRNNSPVMMELKSVSCMTCSGGRVAVLPSDVTRQLLQMSVVQGFPQGLVSGLPVGMVGPAANFDSRHEKLQWQSYDFLDNPHATYKIPASSNADGWSPQWGILELLFAVSLESKTITAMFDVYREGSQDRQQFKFELTFEGVEPFGLSRSEIAIGEISEASAREHKFEVLVYSSTRGPGSALGDLAIPTFSVDMPAGYLSKPGSFVTIGDPIRVPDTELLPVMEAVSRQLSKPTRVRAAYRLPVVVRTRVGEEKIDLGPVERLLSITVPNTFITKTVSLRGTVTGGIWLEGNRREVRLSDTYKRGTTETYRIVTDNPNAELYLVGAECHPPFMKVEPLEKLPASSDRGYFNLKIKVPPESKAGPWSGIIVLELKGPNPQRIRIPIFGNGGG